MLHRRQRRDDEASHQLRRQPQRHGHGEMDTTGQNLYFARAVTTALEKHAASLSSEQDF